LVDGQGAGVVGAHGQPDGVAAGHIAVLAAVVELVLLLVEAVHQVAGAASRQTLALGYAVGGEHARRGAGGVLRRDVVVDRERPVEEVAGEGGRGGGVGAGGRPRGGVVSVQRADSGGEVRLTSFWSRHW